MGLFNKGERGSAPMKRDALSRRGSAELARKSFSMTVGALEKALLKEFPAEDAEGWDRTGLLVGERALPVARGAVLAFTVIGAAANQRVEEKGRKMQAGGEVCTKPHRNDL